MSENQRRAVTVSLRLLEERLANVDRMIHEGEQGTLYSRPVPFTVGQVTQMEALIAAMRDEIRRVAAEYELPSEEQNAARAIVGALAMSWESLEEVRPRRLRNYGSVDPGLKETLEPRLKHLIRLLFDLQATATGERD
ncbi:MAG: hypothetical protein M1482_02910 [Chloroflexi bacterium]|nr:hypothetical protein [Chloroflexota bacterium]